MVGDVVCDELLKASVLIPFTGRIVGDKHKSMHIEEHYIAPQGMSSVCKYFLDSVKASVHFKYRLKTIDVDSIAKKVVCRTECGMEESFDGVVLTLPVPQLLQLDGNLHSMLDTVTLSTVSYSSRFALALFYSADTAVDHNWTAQYCEHPVVRFLCWDHLKKGAVDPRPVLLVHSSVAFGVEHASSAEELVTGLLLKGVTELLPSLPQPLHSRLQKWRYSQVINKFPGSNDMLVVSHDPLVMVTGDSFSGSNFVNCLRAAKTTAHFIVKHY